jgi:ubiquinone/menaquinone biosynthesis C-methylase UbiE
MATGFQFDPALAQRIEALYRTDDAARRRQAVLNALQLERGEQVLDIGTGPGFLALEMASTVGSGGKVVGVDTSEPMLQLARSRCSGISWTESQEGNATNLPLEDASFHVAASVQVFEYIADVMKALSEMYRVLRPGGRAAVVSTDWESLVWHSNDKARMDRVLAAFKEHCALPDLPRTLGTKLKQAGFTLGNQRVIVQFNPTFDANAYSYHAIDIIRSFVPGRKGVTEAEAEAWASELRQLGEAGEYFFCLNQFLFLAIKPD